MQEIIKNAPIFILLTIRFFNSFSNFLLMTLLTLLFLESPFHFLPTQVATLMVILAIGSHGLESACSIVLTKWGKRKSLVAGGLCCGLSLVGLWALPIYSWATLCLILFGASFSLTSLSVRAAIANIKDEKIRRHAFGTQYWVINVAAGIAPVCGFATDYKNNPQTVFIMAITALMISVLIATFFVAPDNERQMLESKKAGSFRNLRHHMPEIKRVAPYYLVTLVIVYSLFQISLVPFYFKTFSIVPQYMGFILALNPVLIILFQGQVTRVSAYLHEKSENLEFLTGVIAVTFSFLLLFVAMNPVTLVIFILLQTLGEMLIFTSVDFAITRNVSSSIQILFLSMTGLMIAFGRALAEGLGVWGISRLHEFFISSIWWWGGHAVLFTVVSIFFVVIWKPFKMGSPVIMVSE